MFPLTFNLHADNDVAVSGTTKMKLSLLADVKQTLIWFMKKMNEDIFFIHSILLPLATYSLGDSLH